MDVYQQYEGEEILNVAMADGLSGTYSTAVMAEIFQLTPAFITQGGPGCVAVQVIQELQEA